MSETINWVPHQHRILVKIQEVEKKTAAGIILADNIVEKEQNQQVLATIISVGPTAEVDHTIIKPGARVMIAKWGGADIPGQDKKLYRVINDEDINAVEIADD